jgi:hypothetical protein
MAAREVKLKVKAKAPTESTLKARTNEATESASDSRDSDPPGPQAASDLVAPEALRPDEFAKISEVEGIRLSPEMERAFAEFEAQGLSPEERRGAIIARFK